MESGDCKTRKSLCFVKAKRTSAGENGIGRISNNFGRASFRTNKGPKEASQYCKIYQEITTKTFIIYLITTPVADEILGLVQFGIKLFLENTFEL